MGQCDSACYMKVSWSLYWFKSICSVRSCAGSYWTASCLCSTWWSRGCQYELFLWLLFSFYIAVFSMKGKNISTTYLNGCRCKMLTVKEIVISHSSDLGWGDNMMKLTDLPLGEMPCFMCSTSLAVITNLPSLRGLKQISIMRHLIYWATSIKRN